MGSIASAPLGLPPRTSMAGARKPTTERHSLRVPLLLGSAGVALCGAASMFAMPGAMALGATAVGILIFTFVLRPFGGWRFAPVALLVVPNANVGSALAVSTGTWRTNLPFIVVEVPLENGRLLRAIDPGFGEWTPPMLETLGTLRSLSGQPKELVLQVLPNWAAGLPTILGARSTEPRFADRTVFASGPVRLLWSRDKRTVALVADNVDGAVACSTSGPVVAVVDATIGELLTSQRQSDSDVITLLRERDFDGSFWKRASQGYRWSGFTRSTCWRGRP